VSDPPDVPEEALATEERLRAVTIGQVQRLDSTITLSPYDPEWPVLFQILKAQITSRLGANALLVEHVGSTSVPGLAAKPIIDVVLAVPDSADEPAYVTPLEAVGYALRIREPEWFAHRVLKPPAIAANIHVFSGGCEEIGRMLAFRDRLRADAGDRQLYERTKQDLAARTWTYLQDYADAKSQVVQQILERALNRG
jgi:GrpB-like predicted nucleotidyltransferase (UPF0157 family)